MNEALAKLSEDLMQIEVFADLSPDERTWLAEQATELWLAPGEAAIAEGDPADRMMALLSGEMQGRREKGGSDAVIFTFSAGEVGGMLPFSRMRTFSVTARALVRSHLAFWPSAIFPEMLRHIPALEPRLVGVLTDRVRESTRLDQTREKLMALGKLSAGLAHELNNPAAAVQRAAAELRDRLVALRSLAARLIGCGIEPGAMQGAVDLYRAAIERSRAGGGAVQEDPIAVSDREERLGAWLEELGVERPWVLAGTFAGYGIEQPALQRLEETTSRHAMPCLICWMEGGLAAEGLLADIASASHRISELVSAVKSYSHMDDGQGRDMVDLRRELESTLTILTHKARKKGVQVKRDFQPDLPLISAYPGELNQVWTNLLDNALDAVAEGGHIAVRAFQEGDALRVDIRDDGPGIPPEFQDRIWEPFFTTKAVGEGTGLGLEVAQRIVVRRHGGAITLTSVPGDTCFTVCLPLHRPVPAGAAAGETAVPGGAPATATAPAGSPGAAAARG
jgi:signal transduction histidine kinase